MYYDLIHYNYFKRFHDYYYSRIIIFSVNFQKFTDFKNAIDKSNPLACLLKGISSLQAAGAELILVVANSPLLVFHELEKQEKKR